MAVDLAKAHYGDIYITQDGRDAHFIARDDLLERPYMFRVGNAVWTRQRDGRHCETCNGHVYPAIIRRK